MCTVPITALWGWRWNCDAGAALPPCTMKSGGHPPPFLREGAGDARFPQTMRKACVRMREMFPLMDGFFRKIRRRGKNTPVYVAAGKKNALQRRATLRKEYER